MKKKQEIEFRYYEVPEGELVLPLIGKSWIREYGNDTVARLHVHNLSASLLLSGRSAVYPEDYRSSQPGCTLPAGRREPAAGGTCPHDHG